MSQGPECDRVAALLGQPLCTENAVVHQCVISIMYGKTAEEALVMCVVALAGANAYLQKTLEGVAMRSPMPFSLTRVDAKLDCPTCDQPFHPSTHTEDEPCPKR